jgi:hypothetical protein
MAQCTCKTTPVGRDGTKTCELCNRLILLDHNKKNLVLIFMSYSQLITGKNKKLATIFYGLFAFDREKGEKTSVSESE